MIYFKNIAKNPQHDVKKDTYNLAGSLKKHEFSMNIYLAC